MQEAGDRLHDFYEEEKITIIGFCLNQKMSPHTRTFTLSLERSPDHMVDSQPPPTNLLIFKYLNL